MMAVVGVSGLWREVAEIVSHSPSQSAVYFGVAIFQRCVQQYIQLESFTADFMVISQHLGAFLPLDSIFSTQGIMVMLLGAYALAMWMFLTSAPKVHTIMVSDLEVAQQFYEGLLNLPVADVPLHYYYNYERAIGPAGIDPFYLSATSPATTSPQFHESEGLWYQLKKNTQVHIITGANYGHKNRHRHVCFDRDCLEQILLRVQSRRLKYKIRQERPLNFLVKDLDDRVIEVVEVKN